MSGVCMRITSQVRQLTGRKKNLSLQERKTIFKTNDYKQHNQTNGNQSK